MDSSDFRRCAMISRTDSTSAHSYSESDSLLLARLLGLLRAPGIDLEGQAAWRPPFPGSLAEVVASVPPVGLTSQGSATFQAVEIGIGEVLPE